jgi:hypothetical protein
MSEPKRIRLTEDFIDLRVGMAYPAGTELVRLGGPKAASQYGLEGTGLGQECVAGLFLLKGLYEIVEQ